MGPKLLIRAYNVGCGDCLYVRIPEGPDGFHILIDCGRKGAAEPLLRDALRHLAEHLLPPGRTPGKKRLDLVVATHRHEDHIKGFDPAWFEDLEVGNIWLSAVMDPNHPGAEKANRLHALAGHAMRGLLEGGHALSPEIEALAELYRRPVSNEGADDLLMKKLPEKHGIQPRYVHSGMSGSDLGLPLQDARIHVLAPERDIDRYYLGDEPHPAIHALSGSDGAAVGGVPVPGAAEPAQPGNISAADFRLLRSRMLSNGLAFAAKDTSIQNNVSVVLLIEWRKRRLLFVGDAEWEGEYREGKHNGSWNVMWEKHRSRHLAKPLDFLKIGHHGSINATPPPARPGSAPAASSVFRILDTLLPVPRAGRKPTARAVVSTEREYYNPIPESELLVDLARRVANTRNYGRAFRDRNIPVEKLWDTPKARREKFYEKYEKPFLDQPQPLRTDLEFALHGTPYIDVELDPGN